MMEHFKPELMGVLPFMLSLQNEGASRVNIQRIVEAVIIAGVTAGLTMYGTQQVIKVQIENLKAQVLENRADIKDLDSNLNQHVIDEMRRIVEENSK